MKNFTISSLTFSAAGNATAYNAFGVKAFVHKKLLAAAGIDADSEITYPLFAIIDTVSINPFDAEGKPTVDAAGQLVFVDRVQAMSIFLTKAEIITAHTDNASLDLQITAAINAEATSLGVTSEMLQALASVVI